SGGTLRERVWLKDSTHAEADNLTLASTLTTALKLDGTSTLDLRVQVASVTVSKLDVEIVHGGDAANNLYSAGFGNVTLTYGSNVTNMSVLYVNKNFVLNSGDSVNIVSTQLPGQAPSPAIGPNSYNRIVVRFDNAVTPATVDSFTAQAQGAGVLLEWELVSEFQNAGFNVYRRKAGGGRRKEGRGWERANSALIAGRITHAGAKTYRFYDWAGRGTFEYRLECVDIRGVPEHYSRLAACCVDDDEGLNAVGLHAVLASVEGLQAVERGARLVTLTANAAPLRSRFLERPLVETQDGAANSAFAERKAAMRAKTTRVDRFTDSVVLAALGVPVAQARAAPSASAFEGNVLPRFLATSGGASGRSSVAAKIVYRDSGVMLVPQAALPAGFSARAVNIQREGRAVTALALVNNDLLLYAPGYSDDYTDKDAFFLTRSTTATRAGVPASATGLFGGLPAATSTSAMASTEFHDVYFDWNLRPYSYPPWFSSQYLTDGSTQRFTISAPNAAGGDAAMTLNVFSLTGGDTVSPDHNIQAFVNGVSVGNASWDGGSMALALSFTVPAQTLVAGDNVVELVTPAIEGVANQIVLLRSISVSYTKALDASSGPVELTASAAGPQVVEVAGLPSLNAWVVDARFTDQAHLIAYQAQVQADGSYKVRFSTAPGGSGKYLVVPAGSELAPLSVSKRTVKPIPGKPRYLAVGPAQFSAALQPLLAAHGKEGLSSVFADQEQIFDYYGYGRYGPVPIQNAIWSVRPAYVLLAGRTTYDYHDYAGAGVDPLCPTFLISTSFWAQTAGDALFGDLGRGYAEIAVGRLPANTPAEMQGAVQHTLAYKGMAESAWRGHAVADRADANAGDFAVEADGLIESLAGTSWSKSYLGVTYQTAPEVNAAMTAAASGADNFAADLIVYIGHGNAARLGKDAPRILDTDSVQNWTGNVVFLQSTCTANWFANDVSDYKSIAIQALTQPQGGIAASIATTTYCASPPAVDFMTQLLQQTQLTPARWGDALLRTQQYSYWKSAAVPSETGAWYADLAKTECLLGDPALNIFAKPPDSGSGVGKGKF
ncbi:MAG TPA: C25 family cysteine peptidase, partial [Planctomycetota bacterium]|nr:C25 family cysteine peptidase [Planctomycetota bacterium]